MNPSDKKSVQSGDRSYAEDRSEGLRRNPESDNAGIPELEESAAKGPGDEDSDHTEATMPPGQGTDPKRNTL